MASNIDNQPDDMRNEQGAGTSWESVAATDIWEVSGAWFVCDVVHDVEVHAFQVKEVLVVTTVIHDVSWRRFCQNTWGRYLRKTRCRDLKVNGNTVFFTRDTLELVELVQS